MTEDIAAKIRADLDEHEAHCLDPACTGNPFEALRAVLALCDKVSVDNEGNPYYAGIAFAQEFRNVIAKELGISVSPLPGPSDQSGVGVRPGSGDPSLDWAVITAAVQRGVADYARAYWIPAHGIGGPDPAKKAEGWGQFAAPHVVACIQEDLRRSAAGVLSAEQDAAWLEAEVRDERTRDAQTGYEGR